MLAATEKRAPLRGLSLQDILTSRERQFLVQCTPLTMIPTPLMQLHNRNHVRMREACQETLRALRLDYLGVYVITFFWDSHLLAVSSL